MSHVDSDTINHVSLCSGYGGIDLGLNRAIGERLRTVAFVEIEAFAAANLAAKAEAGLLDNAPIWSDLKRFPWGKFHGLVDILSGGYPCQPFSAAGKRLGAEDPRHLWPFISAGIAAMRPSVCFFENVEGHISLGLSDVIEDLGRLGYRATWCVASASECGAPHQRKRVFILAYDGNNAGAHFWSRFIDHRGSCQAAHVSPQAADQQAWRDCGEEGRKDASSNLSFSGCWSAELADSQCAGLERQHHRDASAEPAQDVRADTWASGECDAWPSRPGELADTNPGRQPPSLNAGSSSEEIGRGQEHTVAPCGVWPSRPGEQQFAWEPPRVVADSKRPQRRPDNIGTSGQRHQEAGEAGACGESMGHPNSPRPQERPRQRAAGIQGADADGGETADGEAEFSMGDPAYGTSDGLGVAELSGLSDQELAEIRHWMAASDNRTDELRLLGNGVVPACAERAFRILIKELIP